MMMNTRARKIDKPIRYAQYLGVPSADGHDYPETIDGLTPFDAARLPNLPIVAAFVYAGFAVETKERSKGEGTLLHNAALTGDVPMISFLLDIGADINALNGVSNIETAEWPATFGQTPLFWAAYKGHVEAVTTLLNYGAKPNVVDGSGHLATYQALAWPLVLHLLHSRGVDVTAKDDAHRTSLHDAASLGLRTAIQYMVEVCQMDVNQEDRAGNTPLHLAARLPDPTGVKTLLHKGAATDKANKISLTPWDVASPACRSFMARYALCPNATQREKMLTSEPTNFEYLLSHPQMVLPACVTLIVPNAVVVLASLWDPLAGFFSVLSIGAMMAMSAKVQSSSRRMLVTPGWFTGALATGGTILLTQVFPQYRQASEHAGFLEAVWVVTSLAMFYAYMRSVFADPGIIPSTAAARAELYSIVAKGCTLDKNDYCMTCMICKPHRSKHCSTTGHCVYRFDHYCVWTGNAVGAGSHRFFMMFLILQTVSQSIVAYTTFYVMFGVRPYEDGVTTPTSLIAWISFIFLPQNTVVTYFLLFYNSLIFLFMGMVLMTQVSNTNKNQTSNESWFASRYRWMFVVGNKCYSLYDHGTILGNWKEFWFGNLRAEHFAIPDMPAWLQEKTRAHYANKGAATAGGHSHSHGGEAPPAADFQSAVLAATNALPPEKVRELKLMQTLLMQVTQGKTDFVLPDDITEKERTHLLAQAEVLRERHRLVMAQMAGGGGGGYGGHLEIPSKRE